MNRADSLRFATYLSVGALVVAAVAALRAPIFDALTRAGVEVVVLGRTYALARYLADSLSLLLPLAGALLAEFLLTGGRYSTLGVLRDWRDPSVRTDGVFLLIALTPLAMPILLNVFTFGLIAALNRLVRGVVPPDLHLFDASVRQLGWAATIALFFMSKSFIDYWLHRLFHTPVLWPLHRMHHSATRMTLATSVRGHPAGQVFAPFAVTLPMLLWQAPEQFLLLFLAFHMYHEILVHSHADIDWGWYARWVQAAPVNHKLHHSLDPRHVDRNFSTNLPLWDRLFGTFAHEPRIARVGIATTGRERGLWIQMLVDLDDTRRALVGAVRQRSARGGPRTRTDSSTPASTHASTGRAAGYPTSPDAAAVGFVDTGMRSL